MTGPPLSPAMLTSSSSDGPWGAGRPRPMFHRIPLPTGLERTLEELAREVLRRQPDDIYRFCHRFFQHRLEQREGEGRATSGLCEEHLYFYWPVFLSVNGADIS